MSPPSHVVSRAPIDILIRLPDILAPAAETERLEAHRLERDVAGEDHQVGPRNLAAILLLDRPEQAPRFVQADVVRPTVERREALLAPAAAAATIAGAIRAGAVPGHANEQRAVVAEVRRPPILRIGHQRREIFLHRREVEALEFLGVIEVLAHRIGLGRNAGAGVRASTGSATSHGSCAAAGCVVEGTFGFG